MHVFSEKIIITAVNNGAYGISSKKNADHMNQNATRETFSSEIPHYSYACLCSARWNYDNDDLWCIVCNMSFLWLFFSGQNCIPVVSSARK